MKKKIAILLSSILIMYPSVSKADIDFLSIVQDKIAEIQERINLVMLQYTGMQVDLAKLVTDRGAFLDDLRSQAKALAIDKAMALADNIKVGALSMPGISDKITAGVYVTPELRNALANQYLKRSKKSDDLFEHAWKESEKNNNLAIENLAAMFAQAIVKRNQLTEESTDKKGKGSSESAKNEQTSAKTTTEFVQKYMEISRQANERWINLLAFIAFQEQQLSALQAAAIKVDNVSDITGNLDDNKEDGLAFDVTGGTSLLSIYNTGVSAYNNIKNGDVAGAFRDVTGTATEAFGNVLTEGDMTTIGSFVTGVTAGQDALNSAANGDWNGALGALAGGSSDILNMNGEGDVAALVGAGTGLVYGTEDVINGDGSFDSLMNSAYGITDNVGDALTATQNLGERSAEKNDPNRNNNGKGENE